MANNEAFEKALDIMIDDALNQVAEKESSVISPVADVHFSKEHEEKMHQLFRSLHRAGLISNLVKYGKRVACVCLIAFVAAAVSIVSVDAWRTKFIKLIYDESTPNSDYFFRDYMSGYNDEHISLSYLPQGFELVKEIVSSKSVILHFAKDDLYLQVSVSDLNMQSNTDTENATIEQLTIQGYDAIGIYKDDLNQVIWSDNEKAYYIAGNLFREEIEKIAKNCKKN